jgi:hypothetical protein
MPNLDHEDIQAYQGRAIPSQLTRRGELRLDVAGGVGLTSNLVRLK